MVDGNALSKRFVFRYACRGLHAAGSSLGASEQHKNRNCNDGKSAGMAALFEAAHGDSGAPANAGTDSAVAARAARADTSRF